jgi:hypothetical protein
MNPATLVNLTAANSDEWLLLFVALSLDIVQPYLDQMSLQLPLDVPVFVEGVRKTIAEFTSRHSEETDDADLSRMLLEWVLTAYGKEFLLHLKEWKTNVFKPDDVQAFQAYIWRILVTRGGLSGQRDVQPPPPFVTAIRLALSRFPSSNIPITPQSIWDRQLFERYDYDDGWNPMTYVTAAVSHHRFVISWDGALHSKVPFDLDELKRWARREAEVKKMPIDQVKDPVWPPSPKPWR